MSKNRTPSRIACWLLRHNDAMLGDIQEQLARGKSRLWFWQEVTAAIFTGAYVSIFTRRDTSMKRAIVWTTVLAAVFSLGYLTARSSFFVQEEMPSADLMAEMKAQRRLADEYRRHIQREGTSFFMKSEVRRAELEYDKSRTAASKAKLDGLRSKLERVQRDIQNEPAYLNRWVER